MIPDPAPPFDFSSTGGVRDTILRVLQAAARIGIHEQTNAWLTQMDLELRFHPRSWGDPIRNLTAAKAVMYRGRVGPFIAYYSVHDRLPFVVLSMLFVEVDHPLSRALNL